MGVYDTMHLRCPECRAKVSEQTKAAAYPGLRDLTPITAPADVLAAFEDRTLACPNGHLFHIEVQRVVLVQRGPHDAATTLDACECWRDDNGTRGCRACNP